MPFTTILSAISKIKNGTSCRLIDKMFRFKLCIDLYSIFC